VFKTILVLVSSTGLLVFGFRHSVWPEREPSPVSSRSTESQPAHNPVLSLPESPPTQAQPVVRKQIWQPPGNWNIPTTLKEYDGTPLPPLPAGMVYHPAQASNGERWIWVRDTEPSSYTAVNPLLEARGFVYDRLRRTGSQPALYPIGLPSAVTGWTKVYP
jgi:hypothetical protein